MGQRTQRYEYSNHYGIHIQYDSYMVPENALPVGSFRLLEVDNYVILPVGKAVRMLVTSTDVLHSWAVPSLGVKLDACPGRLNQVAIQLTRPGKFFGQCSEICGLNHGFMPIGVRGVSVPEYLLWYDGSLLWEAYETLYPDETKDDVVEKIFSGIENVELKTNSNISLTNDLQLEEAEILNFLGLGTIFSLKQKQIKKHMRNILTITSLFTLTQLFFSPSWLDAPIQYQIGLQAPATPIMEGIINFHNHIMFFIVGIACFVFWLLYRCFSLYVVHENSNIKRRVANFTHSTMLEVVWTIVPALILMVIAVPSFSLLYAMDEMVDPSVTFKTIGHQWYWKCAV